MNPIAYNNGRKAARAQRSTRSCEYTDPGCREDWLDGYLDQQEADKAKAAKKAAPREAA